MWCHCLGAVPTSVRTCAPPTQAATLAGRHAWLEGVREGVRSVSLSVNGPSLSEPRGRFTTGRVQIVVYRDRDELRKELERRGWSQGELARRCGVTRACISQILLGRTPGRA